MEETMRSEGELGLVQQMALARALLAQLADVELRRIPKLHAEVEVLEQKVAETEVGHKVAALQMQLDAAIEDLRDVESDLGLIEVQVQLDQQRKAARDLRDAARDAANVVVTHPANTELEVPEGFSVRRKYAVCVTNERRLREELALLGLDERVFTLDERALTDLLRENPVLGELIRSAVLEEKSQVSVPTGKRLAAFLEEAEA